MTCIIWVGIVWYKKSGNNYEKKEGTVGKLEINSLLLMFQLR